MATRTYLKVWAIRYFVYFHTLKLMEEQLNWLAQRIPDHERSPKRSWPPTGKRTAAQGIFWMLDKLDEGFAEESIELIAPRRDRRKLENVTRDDRPLRRY